MIAMTQKSIGQYLAFLLAEYILKHTYCKYTTMQNKEKPDDIIIRC